MIKKICLQCGAEFFTYPSTGKIFCTRKCMGEYQTGEGNPFYGKTHSEDSKMKIGQQNKDKLAKENHPNWKGGIKHRKDGYIRTTDDEYLHRQIMEQYLGRKLEDGEVVHHINGDTSDNRLENLELSTNSKHRKMHVKSQKRDFTGKFTKGE